MPPPIPRTLPIFSEAGGLYAGNAFSEAGVSACPPSSIARSLFSVSSPSSSPLFEEEKKAHMTKNSSYHSSSFTGDFSRTQYGYHDSNDTNERKL